MIVEINNRAYQVKEGDNLEDVIKQNFKQKNIVAAKVNDKLTDLSDCIEDNSKVMGYPAKNLRDFIRENR